MIQTFRRSDQEDAVAPLHYKACGLDDIYLINGFQRHQTAYGEGYSIEHVDALHKAIALHLVMRRKTLRPKEIRFLRKQLDMTQDELANELSITGQTVARYEKGDSEIPGPVDKMIRVIYVLHQAPPKLKAALEKALEAPHQDAQLHQEAAFANEDEHWRIVPAFIADKGLTEARSFRC
jgi:DNA-binding transcriptional regulator YiaG